MHVASSDLSEFTEIVSNHFRSHDASGPDRINGNLEARSFGGVGLTRMRYGARVDIEADPLGSFALLQIPIRGTTSEPDAGGRHRFSLDEGQILSPARPIDFAIHRHCTLLITRFENRDIESMLTSLCDGGNATTRMNAMARCDLTSPAGRALISQLAWLNFELDKTESSLHRMERHFSNNLLASFLFAAIPELSRDGGPLPSISTVRRVEAYMDANLHEPITVADLARTAGVPVRSLYDLFRRYKQETPAALLRQKRLQAAARLLRAAAADETTVTDVAMSCGFVHIGRFAQYYRAAYGEKPSATLSRRKTFAAPRPRFRIH